MAHSKFTVRAFFVNHPVLTLLVIIVVLSSLTAGVALLFQQVTKGQESTKAPASTSSPVPTPTTSVPEGEAGDGDHNEDAIATSSDACSVKLSAEEYETFSASVLDYEAMFQSPPSAARTLALSKVTTAQYQTDHASNDADSGTDTIVTVLRDKTTVACAVNSDGSRLASAHVVIETSFINSSGKKEIIYPELTLPLIHYSTWVMNGGTWKVSSEQ